MIVRGSEDGSRAFSKQFHSINVNTGNVGEVKTIIVCSEYSLLRNDYGHGDGSAGPSTTRIFKPIHPRPRQGRCTGRKSRILNAVV